MTNSVHYVVQDHPRDVARTTFGPFHKRLYNIVWTACWWPGERWQACH